MITQKIIFLQYENPYYTIDGASRGYTINFREFDYSSFGITDYNTSSYSAAVTFGFPISEIQRLGFNVAFEHTELRSNQLSSREILDFLEAEGDIFDTLKVQGYWTRATLNRGIFPNRWYS